MRRLPSLLLSLPPALALGVLLVACGGSGVAPVGEPEEDSPAFGLETRVPLDPLAFPEAAPPPAALELRPAFARLAFRRPVFLTAAPDGSDWLYVVEQDGRILVFRNQDDVAAASTFLDLRGPSGPVSRASNEEGMLGLAFDPGYGTSNGTFWVYYSAASPRRSVLARHTATFPAGGAPVATAGSGRVVLEVGQSYSNHNGGMIAFGPDDMLYVALGDGGSGNDPQGNGQDLGTLLGSILRLDVRGRTTYGIPPDNPFVATPGARGEIWARGLRNPWRFSFDRATGDLWAGDVGQGAREEVDRIGPGDNLGWPVYEGDRSHLNPAGLPPDAFTAPVVAYPRTAGTTVIGGYVYRGRNVPTLAGAYVYGDYGSGRIWALVERDGEVVSNDEIARLSQVVSFGEDEQAELYAVSLDGSIRRFALAEGSAPPRAFPTRLSETGLFRDAVTMRPNPGLVPYEVIAPLWSDGATKRRWLALPNGTRIAFDAAGAWGFPRGTVLMKHFELLLRTGDPSSAWRLETRVLIHGTAGWRGYTYRWNADQTDADLLVGAEADVFTIEDASAPGGQRAQRYDYPSGAQCLACHTAAAGSVLGVRTLQLNRDFDYPLVVDNQLRSWNHIALFDRDIGPAGDYGALFDPSDASLPLDRRARSYLEANCAACHRPGGPAPGDMDLRFSTPRAAMNLVDVRPTEGDLGLPDAWRVRAGDRGRSVLYERVRRRGPAQMPPLASNEVDAEAVGLLGSWIDGL